VGLWVHVYKNQAPFVAINVERWITFKMSPGSSPNGTIGSLFGSDFFFFFFKQCWQMAFHMAKYSAKW